MRTAIGIMAVASLVWLSYQFWRLLWGSAPIWHTSPTGAVDLKLLHRLVHEWFAGRPVYRELSSAVHPPATYVLLWPMLGWLGVGPARWLWAATTLVALTALVYLVVRESRAEGALERTFMALIPCSIYATGAAIGNGQLIVHLLPMMLCGLLILHQERQKQEARLLGAALILATLVKPPISVPFLWLVLFVPGSAGPVSLIAIGYCILTLFAVSFQDSPLTALLHDWQSRSSSVAVTAGYGNVANLHVWLGSLGLKEWIFPTSLALLLALGLWSYRYRHIDLWLLMGVTSCIARFWTYHRWYDDALILLPIVTLFRIAKRGPSDQADDVIAGVLLAVTLLLMLAPGGLFLLPPPWNTVYVVGQVIVWILTLVFFLGQAQTEDRMRTALEKEVSDTPG
ncbi:MAG: glycosyltransferase family 87 protein [Gemmatimonadales bacterium]